MNDWYLDLLAYNPQHVDMKPRKKYYGLFPWVVCWTNDTHKQVNHRSESSCGCYNFEQLKEAWPKDPLSRDQLKFYCKKAMQFWHDGRKDWVKIHGARTVQLAPTVATPVPSHLYWPHEIHQEAGRRCAFNSLRNLGFDLAQEHEFCCLFELIEIIRAEKKYQFIKVDGSQPRGRFVYLSGIHCFSRIDKLYVDTDPCHPSPVISMADLGISSFNICYIMKTMKKRARESK